MPVITQVLLLTLKELALVLAARACSHWHSTYLLLVHIRGLHTCLALVLPIDAVSAIVEYLHIVRVVTTGRLERETSVSLPGLTHETCAYNWANVCAQPVHSLSTHQEADGWQGLVAVVHQVVSL
jgi:hypothetical protein